MQINHMLDNAGGHLVVASLLLAQAAAITTEPGAPATRSILEDALHEVGCARRCYILVGNSAALPCNQEQARDGSRLAMAVSADIMVLASSEPA